MAGDRISDRRRTLSTPLIDRSPSTRGSCGGREAPPDRTGPQSPVVFRLSDPVLALLPELHGPAAYRRPGQHGLRALRIPVSSNGAPFTCASPSMMRSIERSFGPTSDSSFEKALRKNSSSRAAARGRERRSLPGWELLGWDVDASSRVVVMISSLFRSRSAMKGWSKSRA